MRAYRVGEAAAPSDETDAAAPEPATVSTTIAERDLRARIAALEAQALRYETAIDNISQAVCFFDGEERLIYATDATPRCTAWRPNDCVPA